MSKSLSFSEAVCNLKILVIFFLVLKEEVKCQDYVNKFAVHISGGQRIAREVAESHGYVYRGQIGSIEDHYLFEHPHVHRRSTQHNVEHHEILSNHPQVHWFEQQKIVSRKKRDFLPITDDDLNMNRIRKKRQDPKQDLHFNDELYEQMWYYHGGGVDHTDMNVMGAWKRGVTGKNVVITILDDGIERTHDDLKDNYDPYASYDVNAHDPDPMPRYDFSNENRHGTRCAGEVSAKANNTKCVVGVAYDSKIGGVRMLDGDVYDAVEATSLSHNRSHIDIYSASWGPDDDGRVVDGPGVLAKKAFIDGVRLGRSGKGSIFVWASGNGGNQKDSCNCDGYTNSIFTLSISSISQNGRKPWYLEECSSTLATTYSSGAYSERQIGRDGKGAIFVWASGNGGRSKDSCSCDGYTNSIYTMSISGVSQKFRAPFYLEHCSSTLATTFSSGGIDELKIVTVDLHNKCTTTHTGTSASAPLAAGIVALILEVNPTLTWRDVQYITLMTSRPLPDGEWITNGVNRKVSLRYGYGLMDATAMVELAEKWTNVPAQKICEQHSKTVDKAIGKEIPDSGYTETLYTEACAAQDNAINFLEHVQARITIKTKRRGDLIIHLTSPSGTRSTILPQRPNDGDRVKGFSDWAFLSVHFWGEHPVGEWKLEVEVKAGNSYVMSGSYGGSQQINQLIDWTLVMYGTTEDPVNLVEPQHTTLTPPITASPGTKKTTTLEPTHSVTTSTTTTTTTTTSQPITDEVTSGTTNQPITTQHTTEICHPQCLTNCTGPGADQCTACRAYKIAETGECVTSCPNNFYADEFTCKKCDSKCETCTQITANNVMCLKCKPGYFFVEGKGTCDLACDKGYFKDDKSHHCRLCSGVCTECVGSPHKCTACRPELELVKNNCRPPLKPCPSGQYMSASGCVQCPEGCFSCHSNANCTCCNNGIYLQNGNCVQRCDNGYLPFHVNYSSKFVFQQCQQCGNDCNVCPDGFKFTDGVCVQEQNCADGQYFEWNKKKCQQCYSNCKMCLGPSIMDCISCYPPYGYSNILRKCMRCCTDNSRIKDNNCCHCVEEGKCAVPAEMPGQKSKMFNIETLVIVLTVVVIVCIVVISSIVIYLNCRKKTNFPGYSYGKLEQQDALNEW